nr:efflux transporter outer membrane subunit [Rhodomicrobium sp. R_RK_3]
MLLSGCILNPNVPDPVIDVPTEFTTASLQGSKPLLEQDFEMYRSRPLAELVSTARASNLDIAQAVARIHQADAQVRIATQALIPLLDFEGDASQAYGGSGAGRGRSTNVTAALVASYELDFWGRNRAGRYSAQASALASRYDGAVVAIETVSSVAETYFNAVTVRKRIEIARRNLGIAQRTLDAIKARNAAGTASGLDVAQQETLTANVRAQIPPLEQSYKQFVNALAVLLGSVPEHFNLDKEDLFSIRVPRIAAGLPSDLLCRRPDIAFAEAQLAAASFNVSQARAALFPSISITGQGGFQSEAFKNLFRPDSLFYQMAANVVQPLLSAYGLRAELDLNRARYQELLERYRLSVISSFRDVEDALTAFAKTTEQERLLQIALVSARRAYQISEEQLRTGIIDLTQLLDVQQSLFAAEDSVAQARLSRLLATVALYQALGGGWQIPEGAEIAQVPVQVAVPIPVRLK